MQHVQAILKAITLSNFVGYSHSPKQSSYTLDFNDLHVFTQVPRLLNDVSISLRSFKSFNQIDAIELLKIINNANCQYIVKIERDDEFDVIFRIETSTAETLFLEVHKTSFDFELYRGNVYEGARQIHFSTIHTCQAYQMLYMRGFEIPHFANDCVTLESLGLANYNNELDF